MDLLVDWKRKEDKDPDLDIILQTQWQPIVFSPENKDAVSLLTETLDKCLEKKPTKAVVVLKQILCPLLLGLKGIPTQSDMSQEEIHVFKSIHSFIYKMMETDPTLESHVCHVLKTTLPYHSVADTHSYTCLIWNILHLLFSFTEESQKKMSKFISQRILEVDTIATGKKTAEEDGLFVLEDDPHQRRETDADQLADASVATILSFIDEIIASEDETKTQELYNILFLFDEVVASSTSCTHSQFVIFYLINRSPPLFNKFKDHLWRILESPVSPEMQVIQKAGYLTSLLVRCPESMVSEEDIVNLLQYCGNILNSTLDRLSDSNNPVMTRYSLFFTHFQALAHVMVSKSSALSCDTIRVLKLLNLQRLISSPLNPLYVCSQQLCTDFCQVTSSLQLAVCSAVIQRNGSNEMRKKMRGMDFDVKDYQIWLPFHAKPSPLTLSKVRPFFSLNNRIRLDSTSSAVIQEEEERMSGISFGPSPQDNMSFGMTALDFAASN